MRVENLALRALTAEETRLASQCDWTERPSFITIQFSRRIIVEYVSHDIGLATIIIFMIARCFRRIMW